MLGKPSRRTRRRLEQHGRRATARVMEIASWGPTLTDGRGPSANRELALKTKVMVMPDGEPAFELEERFRFPKGAEPAVGDEITVIYDPGDRETAMLAPDAVSEAQVSGLSEVGLGSGGATAQPAADGVDPNQQAMELAMRLQRGEITPDEYAEEQKRLFGG